MDSSTEQLIKGFLNLFRVSLGNASIYSSTHSVFLKSIQEFYCKTEEILGIFKHVEIFIAPHHLIISQKKWEGDPLYEDLAHWLHIRSLKSVTFKRGVTLEEMTGFISHISKRPRDVLEKGGIVHILEEQCIIGISAEALSYAEILKSTKGDRDIWAFLLAQALKNPDGEEIAEVINNYRRMVYDVGIMGLIEESEFRARLEDFLDYLHEHNKDAFALCVGHTLAVFSQSQEFLAGKTIPSKFQEYFKALDARDFANIMFTELRESEELAFQDFRFYLSFIDYQEHEAIVRLIAEKIERRDCPGVNAQWLKKIGGLFFESEEKIFKEIYAPVFFALEKKFSEIDIFHFDREAWPAHYRQSLLNIFADESDPHALLIEIDAIVMEWQALVPGEQIRWFQVLVGVSERKRQSYPQLEPSLANLDIMIARFVEDKVLADGGEDSDALEQMIGICRGGALGPERYLDAVFQQEQMSPGILKTFFKFYAKDKALFFERLNQKLNDAQYVLKFLKSIEAIDERLRLDIFKHLFSTPNPYIRLEALKRMSGLSVCDKSFLAAILKDRNFDYQMREYSLRAMMIDADARREITEVLFSERGPFGKDQSALIEHVRMAGAVGLAEARPRIEQFSRRKFFWNQKLRAQALAVLEKWDHERTGH